MYVIRDNMVDDKQEKTVETGDRQVTNEEIREIVDECIKKNWVVFKALSKI